MGNFGMRFNAGEDLEQPLKDAGFVNVSCKTLKVPFGGTWPKVLINLDHIFDGVPEQD